MAEKLRTAWHPLLVALLRKLLPVDGFEVLGELQLSSEPLRIDTVIVRKLRDARPVLPLLPTLFEKMRDHHLISFKGPTDTLEAEDAAMLQAYVALYLVFTQAPINDISLCVVAPTCTPRFNAMVHDLGGRLTDRGDGLRDGKLGPFPLRVIETALIYDIDEEHLWYAFSPSLLAHARLPHLTSFERSLYQFIYQQVAQFRAKGDPLMYKDIDLAKMSLEELMATLMAEMPLEMRLAGLAPEQRLAGLAPEQRLAGLAPEQRLAGLAPEQRLTGLSLEQLIPALPIEVLRGLSPDLLDTLSPEARDAVKKRLGG